MYCIILDELHPLPQVFDRASDQPEGFRTHVRVDHNMWNYLSFIFLLWEQDKDDDDGLEQYVRRAIAAHDIAWFPMNKVSRGQRQNSVTKPCLTSHLPLLCDYHSHDCLGDSIASGRDEGRKHVTTPRATATDCGDQHQSAARTSRYRYQPGARTTQPGMSHACCREALMRGYAICYMDAYGPCVDSACGIH